MVTTVSGTDGIETTTVTVSGDLDVTGRVTFDGVIVQDNAPAGSLLIETSGKTTVQALEYQGALTGGAGVINIGSGQIHKDASGNVGIGITGDTGYRLSVFGGFLGVRKTVGYNSSAAIGIDIGAANPESVNNSATYAWGQEVVGDANGQSLIFKSYRRNDTAITRLTIDSAGNAGLGVAPSAWGANFKAFDLGAGSAIANLNSVTDTVFTSNAYRTATEWIYKGSQEAAYYNLASGSHAWFTAPSGTAGSPITFTQAMTLTQGGNLLVGGTVDEGSYITAGNRSVSSASIRTQTADGSTGFSGLVADGAGATALIVGASGSAGLSSTESGVIYTTQARPLLFGTANTERARITSGGYFKASNTGVYLDGVASFHEFSNDQNQIVTANYTTNSGSGTVCSYAQMPSGAAGFLFVGANTGVGNKFQVLANGNVQNTNNSYGPISSDPRLKENIDYNVSYLDDLMRLQVCKFSYKSENLSEPNQLGFLTSNIKEVFPKLIQTAGKAEAFGLPEGEPDVETYKASVLLPIAIRALQELKTELDSVKAELASMKGAAQ